jgi:hypothetical protein
MSRKRHYAVECLETFTHVTPPSVLDIHDWKGNRVDQIETAESRFEYVAGQHYRMSSHRAMRDFCKAHNGRFREVVIA